VLHELVHLLRRKRKTQHTKPERNTPQEKLRKRSQVEEGCNFIGPSNNGKNGCSGNLKIQCT
jgi:Zn-dependent peptidase ImmA (M78 family)